MFTHRIYHDVFEIHELADDKGNLIRVVPQRGGIISEFCIDNEPVFYLDKSTLEDPAKNIRGGNPVLFPICGPLEKGSYLWEGTSYEMKQHGFARNLPWRVGDVFVNKEVASINLHLRSNEETRENYPFDFELHFEYIISGNMLNIKQHYINRSTKAMPFYAGFHPYFAVADKAALKLKVKANEYHDLLDGAIKSFSGNLLIPDDKEFNVVFSLPPGGEASFNDGKGQREIILRYDRNYSYVVLWTLPGKDFLCLEPWMGNNNSLNTGENVKTIGSGESLTATVSYIVRDKNNSLR